MSAATATTWRDDVLSGVPEMMDGCISASTDVLTVGLPHLCMPDGTPAKVAALHAAYVQAFATLQAAAMLEQAIDQLHESIAGRLDALTDAMKDR